MTAPLVDRQSVIAKTRPYSRIAVIGAGAWGTALAAVAGTGAPTRDKLLAQFKSHHALFVRETTPAANSWEDKLLGLASRIVTIRPVGESGSSDPATLPIRLEGALVQNDIVKAAE